MQLSLFDIPQPKIELEELFEAYFECRKNKRNTANALAFEMDYESNLVQLYGEINNGTYKIRRSIAFIVDKPLKREIFAADFRDRVVHHLIIGKLNHLFEKQFIHDSYSCRVGKAIPQGKPTKEEQQAFQSSMNSYLGIMKHYKTYKLRKEMIFKTLSGWWWNLFFLTGGVSKFVLKRRKCSKGMMT